MSGVERFASDRDMGCLLRRVKSQGSRQDGQPNLLPDVSQVNWLAMRGNLIEGPAEKPQKSRKDIRVQFEKLSYEFRGQPELFLYHSLAISYLRRDTDHTEAAREFFFACWDHNKEWLADRLTPRWLISTLKTFSDHGRTKEERSCGAAGFIYGNMLIAYETEIISTMSPKKKQIDRFKRPRINRTWGFQPGDDILLNINSFLLAQALETDPAGYALSALIHSFKDGESIFSRVDNYILNSPPFERNVHLSFGERIDPPKK